MSDYLAISAVTATFQRVLQSSIQEKVFGARVTAARPNTLESGPLETGVNMYLFLITPNSAFQQNDPMGRRPLGNLVKKSQTAYDLQYMLSFHGSESDFEPEKLFGSVAQTMQDVLTLTPEMIRDTLSHPNLQTLATSDLADQLEPVRIFPTEISLENLSKIWSVFFQTPYSLSAVYKATVVLIDGTEPGTRALPVRDLATNVSPFSRLLIQQVIAEAGISEPITASSTVLIKGQSLFHPHARVRIGNIEVTPPIKAQGTLTLPLSDFPHDLLRAGVQTIQVVHPIDNLTEKTPLSNEAKSSLLTAHTPLQHSVTSNIHPFILRPTVTQVDMANVRADGRSTYSAEITVEFDLTVDSHQRVVLVLNAWSKESIRSYLYKAEPRTEPGHSITFKVDKIAPGDYLVRAQIDDAESLLTFDTDPESDTFEWYHHPRLTIG